VTLIAGVRFSDGSLLLAISKGEDVSSPAFRDPLTQYHWDQPLKVALLQLIPPKIVVIALIFLGLTLLPVALAWIPSSRIGSIALTALMLTPSLKVVLQNIGAGDGLIIALIIVAVSCPTKAVLTFCFFFIGIWHPHQSFFIGLSVLLAIYLYEDKPQLSKCFAVLGALAVALIVYLIYKANLNFEFNGRSGFVTSHLQNYLIRNFCFAPVAFAPVVLWLALVAPKPRRGNVLLSIWLVILAAVSLIATDVTRVMTIISLPIVLGGASFLTNQENNEPISRYRVTYLFVLVALIPVYSWSGLDYFLWSDLIADFHKWGLR
jgi:hypothetical protein